MDQHSSSSYFCDGNGNDTDSTNKATEKRKSKKNLREKRRATGVVVMPQMDDNYDQYSLQLAQQNALLNEQQSETSNSETTDTMFEDDPTKLREQLDMYIDAVYQWKEAYDRLTQQFNEVNNQNNTLSKEKEILQKEIGSLKMENEALMKVINMMNK